MSNAGMQLRRRPPKPKPKLKKKRKFLVFSVVLLCIVGLTFFGAYLSYNYVVGNMTDESRWGEVPNDPEKSIKVEIPLGSDTEQITKILADMNIISHPSIFKLFSKIDGFDGTYKAGVHLISNSEDYDSLPGYEELMRIMSSNPLENPTIRIMIPEGFTFEQLMGVFEKEEMIEPDEFKEVCENGEFDYKFIDLIPENEERAYRLEGYLFPDTYIFDKKAEEKDIMIKMLDNFNVKFKPEYYERAETLGMTVDEVVTLASIIEKEAARGDERYTISSVFHNRLNSKDISLNRLESCATIQYIFLETEGKVREKILTEDTKIDHSYNTYMHAGLPPGPICCPGEESIKAALYPENTDYLYFVAKGDGSHEFSENFNDHVNAMHRYGQ
jgi:UPF0755 protein